MPQRGRLTIVAVAGKEPLVELWDARRKAGLFEKAFDARVTVKWGDAAATATATAEPELEPPDT